MKRLHLDQENYTQVKGAMIATLQTGDVVAAPTETVYGLLTLWRNEQGRERIFELKERSQEKELQMLAPDPNKAIQFGVLQDQRLEKLSRAFWPGPLTVVVKAEGGTTVGLRCPDNAFLMDVLKDLQEPIAATSANRSGRPPACTADDAVAGLHGEPSLLVDGGEVSGQPSTVVSLLNDQPQLLREGPISLDAIVHVVW